jgi:hypothetical protein
MVKYDCGHACHFLCTTKYIKAHLERQDQNLLDCPDCSGLGKLYLAETERVVDLLNKNDTAQLQVITDPEPGALTVEDIQHAWLNYSTVVEKNILKASNQVKCVCGFILGDENLKGNIFTCDCTEEYCRTCSLNSLSPVLYHAPFPCSRFSRFKFILLLQTFKVIHIYRPIFPGI